MAEIFLALNLTVIREAREITTEMFEAKAVLGIIRYLLAKTTQKTSVTMTWISGKFETEKESFPL